MFLCICVVHLHFTVCSVEKRGAQINQYPSTLALLYCRGLWSVANIYSRLRAATVEGHGGHAYLQSGGGHDCRKPVGRERLNQGPFDSLKRKGLRWCCWGSICLTPNPLMTPARDPRTKNDAAKRSFSENSRHNPPCAYQNNKRNSTHAWNQLCEHCEHTEIISNLLLQRSSTSVDVHCIIIVHVLGNIFKLTIQPEHGQPKYTL